MSNLPARASLFPAGSLTPAVAKTLFTSLYDFIASRMAVGTSGVTAATAAELQSARESLGATPGNFRNRVINGDMSIDQVNGGSAQTIVAAAARAPIVDMHYAYCTGANATGQRILQSDASYRYRFTGAASVTGIWFDTAIAARNAQRLAGRTCTLSARLADSTLTSVAWAVYHATSTNAFGTVASPTRTLIASGTFTVSGTEGIYAAQVAMPAGAANGVEVVLSVGAKTSGTWSIGELQLEPGALTAEAIVHDAVEESEQLARCQRYYQAITGYNLGFALNASNAYTGGHLPFTVPMRAVPTLQAGAIFGADTGAPGTVITGATTSDRHWTFVNSAANWTTNAQLTVNAAFSARLMA